MFLPNGHLVALLQAQALHPEHHFLQHTWQRVGEGNLGGHLLANDSFSHRLSGGQFKMSQEW